MFGSKVIALQRISNVQKRIDTLRDELHLWRFNTENPSVASLTDKLSQYHKKWDETSQTFSDSPAKSPNNHAADACTYAALFLRRHGEDLQREEMTRGSKSVKPKNAFDEEWLAATKRKNQKSVPHMPY